VGRSECGLTALPQRDPISELRNSHDRSTEIS
jgi:hypothetical protein